MNVKHRIEWTYDGTMGRVDAKVICESSPDSVCRTRPARTSGCQCEEFFEIDRDDLSWYHVVESETDDGEPIKIIHRHEPMEDCNIALFMNEDPMDTILEAAADQYTEIVIGSTVIEPVWTGNGYEWRPVT